MEKKNYSRAHLVKDEEEAIAKGRIEMNINPVEVAQRDEKTYCDFIKELEEMAMEAEEPESSLEAEEPEAVLETNEPEHSLDSCLEENDSMDVINDEEAYETSAESDEYEDDLLVEDEEESLEEIFEANLETYDDEDVNEYCAKNNRSQLVGDEDEDYDEREDDFGWLRTDSNDEDTWWALTDGMYGDCPSNPIVYDAMMEAMGY